MHFRYLLTLAASITLAMLPPAHGQSPSPSPDIMGPNKDLIQVSTINALIQGVYDGAVTFGELRRKGNFGIGTFDELDGEMVALDGIVYQVRGDGKVSRVPDNVSTPFASMTQFESDTTTPGLSASTYDDLKALIDGGLPSENLFYAVKVTGEFPKMKVRSVKRQAKPYRPLTEVVEDQAMFDFENTSGTLVGFICPDYVQGVNVAGYHLHYLSDDKSQGGHVLEFELADGTVEVDYLSDFRMMLPQNSHFLDIDLSDKGEEAIHKVEKLAGNPDEK